MTGFRPIVKGIAEALDRAAAAVERAIREAAHGRPGPKPCPIYVENRPPRKRR